MRGKLAEPRTFAGIRHTGRGRPDKSPRGGLGSAPLGSRCHYFHARATSTAHEVHGAALNGIM